MSRADYLEAAVESYQAGGSPDAEPDPRQVLLTAIPDLLAVVRALEQVAYTAELPGDLILWRIAKDALAAFEEGK